MLKIQRTLKSRFCLCFVWQMLKIQKRSRSRFFLSLFCLCFSTVNLTDKIKVQIPYSFFILLSFFSLVCTTDRCLWADYLEIFNPGFNFNLLNRVEIWSRLKTTDIAILCKYFSSEYQVEISTRFSQTEMKFQLEIKIPNFPHNQHFFQPGMKIWFCAIWVPCLFTKKQRWWLLKDVSNGPISNLSIL